MKKKQETKFWGRVLVFFWWNVMTLGWFGGIFSKNIFDAQEAWLINYGKDTNEKFK